MTALPMPYQRVVANSLIPLHLVQLREEHPKGSTNLSLQAPSVPQATLLHQATN